MLKVEELIDVINYSFPRKGKRKPHESRYCSLCGPQGEEKSCRHVFQTGGRKSRRRIPFAPYPAFIDSDDDEVKYDDDVDNERIRAMGGDVFDTAIVRRVEEANDPQVFKLPSVFSGKEQSMQEGGRLLPLVSENTFLTTTRRQRLEPSDQAESFPETAESVRLPRLSNQPVSLRAEVDAEGHRGKRGDPRRLNSERVDRRDQQLLPHGVGARADSVAGNIDGDRRSVVPAAGVRRFLESPEKTDPPPRPIVVSIRNQAGDVLQTSAMDSFAASDSPSSRFAKTDHSNGNRKHKKKQRRQTAGDVSPSPTFSGSITFSRETTLSGAESPNQTFLSRLRSASWCVCPSHVIGNLRCAECRRTEGHEKWCVSRNSTCPNCGKAFKRKYPGLERKSSFGEMAARGSVRVDINDTSLDGFAETTRYHRSSSNAKPTNFDPSSDDHGVETPAPDRVRFTEDGRAVYPEWQNFPDDSGFEDDKQVANRSTTFKSSTHARSLRTKAADVAADRTAAITAVSADVHRKAYDMALASAQVQRMLHSKRSLGNGSVAPKGIYFSYFPLLKTKRPRASEDQGETATPQPIGVRADSREGKRLKVKKGLQHVLGGVRLDDFYPGGKGFPARRTKNKA